MTTNLSYAPSARTKGCALSPALWLSACLVVVACGTGDVMSDQDVPAHDENACASALVPHRLGFAWEDLNHRISVFDATLEPETACVPETVRSRIIGGDFTTGDALNISDDAFLRMGVSRVDTTPDVLGAHRLRIPVRIAGGAVAEGSLTLDREEIALRGYGEIIALVGGIQFDTNVPGIEDYPEDYDPAHGYTSRGFGAAVGISAIDPVSLVLDWRLRFEPGLAKDRDNHNRAVPRAEIDAALDVILVGVPEPSASSAEVAYTLRYERPELLDDSVLDPAPLEDQRVSLPGPIGADLGIVGLRSFDFVLDVEDRSCNRDRDCSRAETCTDDAVCTTELGEPGFYVREISVGVQPESFDEGTGELTALVNGYASNATQLIEFHALTHTFTAEVVRIPLPPDVPVRTLDLDAQFPAGPYELPLADAGKRP